MLSFFLSLSLSQSWVYGTHSFLWTSVLFYRQIRVIWFYEWTYYVQSFKNALKGGLEVEFYVATIFRYCIMSTYNIDLFFTFCSLVNYLSSLLMVKLFGICDVRIFPQYKLLVCCKMSLYYLPILIRKTLPPLFSFHFPIMSCSIFNIHGLEVG